MSVYYQDDAVTLHHGDALAVLRDLPPGSVDCCVTSPPYFGLRDYGVAGQLGAEASPAEYVAAMRVVFAEVRRVLADDATLWLNLGDSYSTGSGGQSGLAALGVRLGTGGGQKADASKIRRAAAVGIPPKNLLGIPWRVAFALQDDGWILRNDNIWAKPNAMPESVTDRLSTKHEYVFMLTKSARYWFDLDAVREPAAERSDWLTWEQRKEAGTARSNNRGINTSATPSNTALAPNPLGRNPGDVWSIPTSPFPEAHFAVMAPALAERCVIAGCKPGGVVLDPFSGVGTTGMVAAKHGRRYVGIELNAETLDLSLRTRLAQPGLAWEVTA